MQQTETSHAQSSLNLSVAILLAMTMAIGPLALDTYLPAFPAMADSLVVSVHEISLSISIYVFMLALGQLVGGPLSDRWGRGVIMLTGLIVFGIASFLISRVDSNDMLLILRAIQAFGGGWATVCVPAIVRDQLSGAKAARFFSLIGLIMIMAPAIAPSIGSLILAKFTWPAIFLMLAIYSLILVVALKFLVFSDQSLFSQLLSKFSSPQRVTVSVWHRYRAVFRTRPALRFMFLQTLSFTVMLLFITHSSFIYQQHFGASPSSFALLFGANIVVMLVANLTNRHLLKIISPRKILRWSVTIQALGILFLIGVTRFLPSLWFFLPAMMITVGVMGAITPNTQACFMDYFSEHGGTASALLGATQFSIAGGISAASALLPESVMVIVLSQAICSFLCLLLVWNRKLVE